MEDDEWEELAFRRLAELEFVTSAYGHDEAWYESTQNGAKALEGASHVNIDTRVFRRLRFVVAGSDSTAPPTSPSVCLGSILLELKVPEKYPKKGFLIVSGTVEEDKAAGKVHDALPRLIQLCQDAALATPGEESIFMVFTAAEAWAQEEQEKIQKQRQQVRSEEEAAFKSRQLENNRIFGRYFLYSHHIISKTKRSDMQSLAHELKLTGFVKIGWPGLIVVEGWLDDCQSFYDVIRRWTWKYLSLRQEEQRALGHVTGNAPLNQCRCFEGFLEIEDMSEAARICREAGLEEVFRSTMRLAGDSSNLSSPHDNNAAPQDHQQKKSPYGALCLVDHMNDAKSYRKWIRKTCQSTQVIPLIKQVYPHEDYSKRPIIIVALIGSREDVAETLKKWRTSRVDVDSKGKPCLERMMQCLVEGYNDKIPLTAGPNSLSNVNMDEMASEATVTTTPEKMLSLIHEVGGHDWSNIVATLLHIDQSTFHQ